MALELNGTTGVSLVQDGVVTAADLASGAITTSALPAGSVLQVVSETYSTKVTNTNGTFTDTGLTATITPTSTTSKILVVVNQNGVAKLSNTYAHIRLLRESTTLIAEFSGAGGFTNDGSYNYIGSASASYLDSPETASAVTYKTQVRSGSNIAEASVQVDNSTSTITLMEIAG